jgi:hypothetical protein
VTRIYPVSGKHERTLEEHRLQVQGYRVVERDDDATELRERTGGSVLLHLLLFVTTFGLGNVAYWLYRRDKADRVRLVEENDNE